MWRRWRRILALRLAGLGMLTLSLLLGRRLGGLIAASPGVGLTAAELLLGASAGVAFAGGALLFSSSIDAGSTRANDALHRR